MKINKIKLNFLDNYYMYYDWLNTDIIKDYYNVNIYKIKSNDLEKIINNDIRINNINDNIYILTDSLIAIGILNKNNKIYKSFILFEDEEEILDRSIRLNNYKIDYHIIKKVNNNNLRIYEKINNVVDKEIENISKNKDINKLSYLYYECFDKLDTYDDMILKLNNINNEDKYKLYKIINKLV